MITIPAYKDLDIHHIVCDYNGTIAKDGRLLKALPELFRALQADYRLYVITADTFGTVQAEVAPFGCEVKVLSTDDHSEEKAAFIRALGAEHCVALGNGNNDALMLQAAALGVAILGEEGCSTQTLLASDLVCKSAKEALELLLYPKRLIATLRR